MRSGFKRASRWLAFAAGGSVLVLSGCDPTVRGTVLNGVEGAATVLSTTFLRAFFESLMTRDEGPATIVRAVTEILPGVVA